MLNIFDIENHGVILQKSAMAFEDAGVLNPACVEKDGLIHMFYRAVSKQGRSVIGYAKLDSQNKVIERFDKPFLAPEYDYESMGLEDPRITLLEGVYYLFYTAFDGRNARVAYATSTDLVTFEKKGLVSPGIKYSDVLALLNRKALPEKYFYYGERYQKEFTKDVIVWEKDFYIFPRKIGGKFALFHRIMPGIQLITVDSLADLSRTDFWKEHIAKLETHVVMNPKMWFENKLIGGGAPPIETKDGWLLIYHAASEPVAPTPLAQVLASVAGADKVPSVGHVIANGAASQGGGAADEELGAIGAYRTSAALLDLHDPRKVIGRLASPLFSPTEEWEKKGFINNVVFPTATIVRDDRLYIYYGAADDCIGLRSVDIKKLLNVLKGSK